MTADCALISPVSSDSDEDVNDDDDNDFDDDDVDDDVAVSAVVSV